MAENDHITLRVGKKTTVTIMFDGPITQAEMRRLIAFLDVTIDTYPEANEQRVADLERGGVQWQNPSAS
jgi:hypothetical protein